MKDKVIFIDTNILVYAYDTDAGKKHEQAKTKILSLWEQELPPWISIQVLQELLVTLQRKGVPLKAARELVEGYLQWNVVENDAALLREGIKLQEAYKVSFWDALILAATVHAGAEMLLSEDFNNGQIYSGVKAVNPFV
jgi:predicted nucleic acid-binding protein